MRATSIFPVLVTYLIVCDYPSFLADLKKVEDEAITWTSGDNDGTLEESITRGDSAALFGRSPGELLQLVVRSYNVEAATRLCACLVDPMHKWHSSLNLRIDGENALKFLNDMLNRFTCSSHTTSSDTPGFLQDLISKLKAIEHVVISHMNTMAAS